MAKPFAAQINGRPDVAAVLGRTDDERFPPDIARDSTVLTGDRPLCGNSSPLCVLGALRPLCGNSSPLCVLSALRPLCGNSSPLCVLSALRPLCGNSSAETPLRNSPAPKILPGATPLSP